LTASPQVRAQRRFDELIAKGTKDVTLESTLAEVQKRDAQDMGREHAPLKQAEGATLVESSNLSIEQTVDLIVDIAKGKFT
jgi:cytidylate kinase